MQKKAIQPTLVRLPEELKTILKQRAEENCRSVNGEIVARLQESLRNEKNAKLT